MTWLWCASCSVHVAAYMTDLQFINVVITLLYGTHVKVVQTAGGNQQALRVKIRPEVKREGSVINMPNSIGSDLESCRIVHRAEV